MTSIVIAAHNESAVLGRCLDAILEITMAADGCINAAYGIRQLGEQGFVQRVAHAVQALELETLDAVRVLDDAGDRERIVGGELRGKCARARRGAFSRTPCSRDRSWPCA